jgi:hypothetical protein
MQDNQDKERSKDEVEYNRKQKKKKKTAWGTDIRLL